MNSMTMKKRQPIELTEDQRVEAYLAAAREANLQLAKEKGWDMSKGMPSYVYTDPAAAQRLQAIEDRYGPFGASAASPK